MPLTDHIDNGPTRVQNFAKRDIGRISWDCKIEEVA